MALVIIIIDLYIFWFFEDVSAFKRIFDKEWRSRKNSLLLKLFSHPNGEMAKFLHFLLKFLYPKLVGFVHSVIWVDDSVFHRVRLSLFNLENWLFDVFLHHIRYGDHSKLQILCLYFFSGREIEDDLFIERFDGGYDVTFCMIAVF